MLKNSHSGLMRISVLFCLCGGRFICQVIGR